MKFSILDSQFFYCDIVKIPNLLGARKESSSACKKAKAQNKKGIVEKYARNVKICSTITCHLEAKREVPQDFAVNVNTHTHKYTVANVVRTRKAVKKCQMQCESKIRIGASSERAKGKEGLSFEIRLSREPNQQISKCLRASVPGFLLEYHSLFRGFDSEAFKRISTMPVNSLLGN